MRWPIRTQILLPFGALQLVALAAVASLSAWWQVRQAEREIRSRIAGVERAVADSAFPMTPATLKQLHELSGAHFAIVNAELRVKFGTLEGLEAALTNPAAPSWEELRNELSLDGATLEVGGERFFLSRVRPRGQPDSESVAILVSEESWHSAWWQAVSPPLVLAALLLGLSVAASIIISHRIGGRIRKVGEQVRQVAEGDFAPIPAGEIDDELRELSQQVNVMAGKLRELVRQSQESERSRLLSQIVGGLSHQLRNAITGARLALQVHQRRCASSDDEAIAVALRQLVLTEEQLKSLLRTSSGGVRPPVPGDLLSILHEVATLMAPVCEHRDVVMTFQTEVDFWGVADSEAWRAAVLNVVENAIEAAGPDGRVEVDCRRAEECLVIDICDDGPGIADAVRETLFQAFVSTKPEGCGLGLALAKQAAADCGGELTARRQEDRTVFRFVVPGESSGQVPAGDWAGQVPGDVAVPA
jgi:signal transduction histidine kinase